MKVKKEMLEEMLKSIEKPLCQAGVKITREHNGVRISLPGKNIKPADIETGPYPSFPTDLLPQWVTFMTQALPTKRQHYSTVKENIWNSRFKFIDGLRKLGAKIDRVNDHEYQVKAGMPSQ